MTADEFWGSTLAQLAALIPPGPPLETGSGSDLLAMAAM